MQTRCVQIANTVFHSCHQCDNIDRLNKYKQQITNNLQLYSCARSQHAHTIRVNWLNIITTRMDDMSYVVNDNTVIRLDTAHSNSKFFKSFFYRTMHIWNSLPLNICKICTLVKFKLEVKNFLWNKLLSNNSLEMG